MDGMGNLPTPSQHWKVDGIGHHQKVLDNQVQIILDVQGHLFANSSYPQDLQHQH
jgi:hypothetical protein